MRIREKIYESIKEMDARSLSVLYEQIKYEMTASNGSWSDAVIQDREDRLCSSTQKKG